MADLMAIIGCAAVLLLIVAHLSQKKDSPVPSTVAILIFVSFFTKTLVAKVASQGTTESFPDSVKYLVNLEALRSLGDSRVDTFRDLTGTDQFLYYYVIYWGSQLYNSPFFFALLNVLLFSVAAALFHRIIHHDFGPSVALTATIGLLFCAHFYVFSTHILKDALVTFLAILAYHVYKFSTRWKVPLLIIILGLLTTTRIYAGIAATGAIFVDVAMAQGLSIQFSRKVKSIVGGVLILIAALQTPFLESYRVKGLAFLDSFSIAQVVASFPTQLIQMFFAPSPLSFGRELNVYTPLAIDSTIALCLVFALIRTIRVVASDTAIRRKLYLYLIPVVVHAAVLGLQYGGGAQRQRSAVIGFMILLYAIGLCAKPRRQAGLKDVALAATPPTPARHPRPMAP